MYAIAETNMLIRTQVELPNGMKLSTQEFRGGWNLVGIKDSRLLERKLLKKGWKFIKIVDGWLTSGVGDTTQTAIASALNLALRHVSPHFNAVEVNHIEWTQYPWFFVAKVMVNPYRIQQGATLPVPDEAMPPVTKLRPKLMPTDAAVFFPRFGSAIPMLKELLVLSRSSQTRFQ
jgi:hypothetical protein